MSDKPTLSGLFVNKKATSTAPLGASTGKQKNVKQRWLLIGIAVIGFVAISSSFLSKKGSTVTAAPKVEGMVKISPEGVNQGDWRAKSSEELARMKAENEKLQGQVAGLSQAVTDIKDKAKAAADAPKPRIDLLPGNIVPPPVAGIPSVPGAYVPPAPPTLPAQFNAGQGTLPGVKLLPTFESAAVPPPAEPQIFKPESKPVSVQPVDGELVKSNIKYKKNPYSGFLPAGSFASVVLLNGLDAGTSSATQANPMPVLMTITGQATLPGAAKYAVKSCFVLGTGYGDLSAERVYVRYSRLSCVDKADKLLLSAEVSGYLVDSDGKIGLRGKVINRQGALLGKALIAGFAQGLSGALGSAQSTVTTTAAGAMSSIGGSDALRASGLSGAQSAAQQLAAFYLKEAQAIFPIISIDTGRTGTIVFTDNASLAWSVGDTQYIKDVTPN